METAKQAIFDNCIPIGTQVWMKENLSISVFQNGDPIPCCNSIEEIKTSLKHKEPAWCYYDFNEENGKKYGKLYNIYAYLDERGLAPEGFMLPSGRDWNILIEFLGDADPKPNLKLRGNQDWKADTLFGLYKGNNETGFTALPAGEFAEDGFKGLGTSTFWWSDQLIPSKKLCSCTQIFYLDGEFRLNIRDMDCFLSVRCLKN